MRLEVAFADRVGIASEILGRAGPPAARRGGGRGRAPAHIRRRAGLRRGWSRRAPRGARGGRRGSGGAAQSTCCRAPAAACISTRCSTRSPTRCWRSMAAAGWSSPMPPRPTRSASRARRRSPGRRWRRSSTIPRSAPGCSRRASRAPARGDGARHALPRRDPADRRGRGGGGRGDPPARAAPDRRAPERAPARRRRRLRGDPRPVPGHTGAEGARGAGGAGRRAVLVLGETGTGKELVARACHRASPRADEPFVALNCAALPESLARERALRLRRAAPSPAPRRDGKPGLLELADGGTVFLDEIGEMSPLPAGQAAALPQRRQLPPRRRRARVAGRRPHRQRDPPRPAGDGRRGRVPRGPLLPPERRSASTSRRCASAATTSLLLARHFLARAAAQARRPACRLTAAAERALAANPWPGNVRQLENAVFRAVTLSDHAALGSLRLRARRAVAGRRGGGDAGGA